MADEHSKILEAIDMALGELAGLRDYLRDPTNMDRLRVISPPMKTLIKACIGLRRWYKISTIWMESCDLTELLNLPPKIKK